jgi:predicted TIM-barrel fold metal-dependent hydrolase
MNIKCIAADYPYESVDDGVNITDEAEISEGRRHKIYSDNVMRIFGLDNF